MPFPLHETETLTLADGSRLRGVHPSTACAGRACVIHAPTDHHMRGWPLIWRDDKGCFERLCPDRGIGHPDPDDMVFHRLVGNEAKGVHGCDGCCSVEEEED